MLKSIGNNSSIPNSYIYTSNKGTEYMYLDGSWINCETMNEVANIHNFKMNKSAIAQIVEHNNANTLKIGKTYSINESKFVYVGRDKFTRNGNLLHESINHKVKKLMEAEGEFSNFIRGDSKELEIPNRFKNGDYVYNKNEKKWSINGNLVDDHQYNKELNTDAINQIKKYNEQDDFPVNSTVDFQGNTLTWNGINWVGSDGKQYGDKFGDKVNNYIESNPEQKTDNSTNVSDNSSDTGATPDFKIPKGKSVQNAKGIRFYYDGNGNFVSSTGDKLPPDEAAKNIKGYEEHQKFLYQQKQPGANPNAVDPSASYSKLNSNGEPVNEPANNSTDTPSPAPEASTDTQSGTNSSIPNGYVFTSGKGKSYINRNGTWIDTSTKKPINKSAANSLERAASASIEKYNKTEKVKIGQQWTSGKGNVFTYVGNNRFISKDGKLLPAGTATQALEKLKNGSTDSVNQETEPTPAEQSSQNAGQVQNAPPATNEPASNTNSNIGNAGNSNNEQNPLQGLADQVKSSPNAPKIIVLLSRGDNLSLFAADILLSGENKEAVRILQSLNNKD